jgi:GNAT superfamily N-acetyltransferase
MINELNPREYEKTRSVFASMSCHLAIESIIQGLTQAKIFVDDRKSPSSAFTWLKGRAWLAGNPDNDTFNEALPQLLEETYYKLLRDHKAEGFLLYYRPDGWKNRMDYLFDKMPRIEALRYRYHLDPTTRSWEIPVPHGLILHPIDASLLSKKHLKNLDDVVEEMQSERFTEQDFLEKSFGYCAIIDKVIAGWCTSEYNVGKRCELGITTAEGYRRRGIATLTATAIIRHALSSGINDIGWHSYADNKPSIATAKSLGFTKHCEYPVCLITLDRS